jgi:hypothetical protein
MRASRIDRANLLPASNRSAIVGEVLDDMHHARCQPVCHGERARQLGTQGPPALADGDATLDRMSPSTNEATHPRCSVDTGFSGVSRILRVPTPIRTPTASQYRTGHTNGTLVRKHRPVRQMAANGFLLPNVIGALGIVNQTPPEHNPPETMTRERTT